MYVGVMGHICSLQFFLCVCVHQGPSDSFVYWPIPCSFVKRVTKSQT